MSPELLYEYRKSCNRRYAFYTLSPVDNDGERMGSQSLSTLVETMMGSENASWISVQSEKAHFILDDG